MFKECEYLAEVNLYDAALNMAVDEVLLGCCEHPVLRVYGWARPAVSFGYFQCFEDLVPGVTGGDHEVVRRWTGGGVVAHGNDWTYSLMVPRSCTGVLGSPSEAYEKIHEELSVLLRECGIAAEAVGGDEGDGGVDCFRNPVKSDVAVAGRKIAGAGQRRTRAGMLHQGSLQGVSLPEDFGIRLAGRLADEVMSLEQAPKEVTQRARGLAAEKYGTEEWLRKY
jgi:lipoate-protein ligase A